MRQLVIMSLLFTSLQSAAMHQMRTAITKQPLTSVSVAAGLGSLLTYASTRKTTSKRKPNSLEKRMHDELRRTIAEEHAEMSLMPSDR